MLCEFRKLAVWMISLDIEAVRVRIYLTFYSAIGGVVIGYKKTCVD